MMNPSTILEEPPVRSRTRSMSTQDCLAVARPSPFGGSHESLSARKSTGSVGTSTPPYSSMCLGAKSLSDDISRSFRRLKEVTVHEEDVPVIIRRGGCMLRVRITSFSDDDFVCIEHLFLCNIPRKTLLDE